MKKFFSCDNFLYVGTNRIKFKGSNLSPCAAFVLCMIVTAAAKVHP